MPRSTNRVPLVACLLSALFAFTTAAQAAPTVAQCRSAARAPGDRVAFLDACRALLQQERQRSNGLALASEPVPVLDARTIPANVNFANVPTWSDADIMTRFAAARDSRYLVDWWDEQQPNFQRRVSWLFPEWGCGERAEQVAIQAAQAGKARPYKLFAWGHLRVYTSNVPEGVVRWNYHVAAVVKNSAGEPIVLDPAVSPCRPLPWKEWLALMVDDMSEYDQLEPWGGVTLADSWAYDDWSNVAGNPDDSAKSTPTLQNELLHHERELQSTLGRNVYGVLGNSPPWSGYSCVRVEPRVTTAAIAPGATTTLNAACPFATKAVGGGWFLGSGQQNISKSVKNGNGWQVVSRNTGSGMAGLEVQANCLTGAPSSASVTTVTGSTVNVAANTSTTASATCASGTLIGGGYATTAGATVLRIFANRRSPTSGNTWQVSAQNPTTTTKSVTPYAYCLANTGFTFSQAAASLPSGSGRAAAACSGAQVPMGGGFSFPRTTAYRVPYAWLFSGSVYLTEFAPSPPGGDPNALSYAECLAHP
jgi:hypothetical protein